MARSDKVKFRREFTILTNDRIGGDQGIFVGDILNLHLSIQRPNNLVFIVEGTIGRTCPWEVLTIDIDSDGHNTIDIKTVEFIRITIADFSAADASLLVLFGFDLDIPPDVQEISFADKELVLQHEIKDLLSDILCALELNNKQLAIITGDEDPL